MKPETKHKYNFLLIYMMWHDVQKNIVERIDVW